MDVFLTAVAGSEFWGPKVKPYKLPTDKFRVGETEKVHVTTASEAFGLIQFEDSRKRWLSCFAWKKTNPGKDKKPPVWSKAKDKETLDFKCKWSDHSHGQGSGWDRVAYKTYKKRFDSISEFREKELQETGPQAPKMMEGQIMIRLAYNTPDDETEPPQKRRKVEVALAEDNEDGDSSDEDFIDVMEE